jgi:hypothetical protein
VRRSLLSVIKLQHRFQRLRHPAEQKIDATIKIVNKKATTRCLYVFLFGVAEQRASERVSSSSHLARIWAIVLHAKELLSVDSRVESAQTLFHITRNNQAPCFASFRTQKNNNFESQPLDWTPDGRRHDCCGTWPNEGAKVEIPRLEK